MDLLLSSVECMPLYWKHLLLVPFSFNPAVSTHKCIVPAIVTYVAKVLMMDWFNLKHVTTEWNISFVWLRICRLPFIVIRCKFSTSKNVTYYFTVTSYMQHITPSQLWPTSSFYKPFRWPYFNYRMWSNLMSKNVSIKRLSSPALRIKTVCYLWMIM
jgi:hypothetical protein